MTTGIGPDLITGAKIAMSEMIELLANRYDYSPIDAYILRSVCADLRISSIVDVPNWVVSFYFPRVVLDRDAANSQRFRGAAAERLLRGFGPTLPTAGRIAPVAMNVPTPSIDFLNAIFLESAIALGSKCGSSMTPQILRICIPMLPAS